MKQNSFLTQFINRLVRRNPKFFAALQWVLLIALIISWLISQVRSEGVIMPWWMSFIGSMAVKISAAVGIVIAQLPNVDPEPPAK